MSVLLEVGELTVRFRVKPVLRTLVDGADKAFIDAVANVSFTLGEGETMGLVGESGSGKTTLARAVIGLVRPAEGSIRFEGEEIAGLSDRAMKPVRRRMSMMFQDPVGSLSPRLPVRSLITEPYRIHGLSDRDRDAECRRLLGLVGLPPDFAGRYPHQLSGGQARRVGVARALALDPKLILADEPTAGLDVSVQGEILNLLARLQDETGVSILMVTHNLNVVRHVTERVAIMYLGRFVETGPTDDIFRAPRHPYTAALLSANPEPDPDARLRRIELVGDIPSLLNRPSGCEFHTRCFRVQPKCADVPPGRQSAGGGSFTCHFPLDADGCADASGRPEPVRKGPVPQEGLPG
jgi:oligopeptide/dipeptide ABC transporter ATP-binding protein